MYKMIAIFKQPENKEAFDQWYKTHVELVKKVPHVKEYRLNKITGTFNGESDLYLMAELLFANKEDFKAAMNSPENMATGKDAHKNAKGLASVYFAEEEVIKL